MKKRLQSNPRSFYSQHCKVFRAAHDRSGDPLCTPEEAFLREFSISVSLSDSFATRQWLLRSIEPAIDTLALTAHWSPRMLWASAIGGPTPEAIQDELDASMIYAFCCAAGLYLGGYIHPGEHAEAGAGTWLNGERTAAGARINQAAPAANLLNWQSALASKSHRRYFA